MAEKVNKMIPYLVLVVLGIASYFFNLPLSVSVFIMGVTLYSVYKCFMIINISNHKIKIQDDGIEYRGLTYSYENHIFEYSEFVQYFLGMIPLQEDYYFWIYSKDGEYIMKINCLLHDLELRQQLAKFGT